MTEVYVFTAGKTIGEIISFPVLPRIGETVFIKNIIYTVKDVIFRHYSNGVKSIVTVGIQLEFK